MFSEYIPSEKLFTPEQCAEMCKKHLADLKEYERPIPSLKIMPSGKIPSIHIDYYAPYYSSARYAIDESRDF